jgi:hypothetical protein
MLAARRGKKCVLPQGVAHQATRRVFLVGVKNRLMPRELAASVLPALVLLPKGQGYQVKRAGSSFGQKKAICVIQGKT